MLKTDIPARIGENVARVFGKRGAEWFERVPDLVIACREKWKLHELVPVDSDTVNIVLLGTSRIYGEIALKICCPHPEIFREMHALRLYDGRGVCRLHDSDEELCALLLERIRPGRELASLDDPAEQALVGARICTEVPIPVDDDPKLVQYTTLLDGAFTRFRQMPDIPEELQPLKELTEIAREAYSRIEAVSGGPVLYHGDLHHWNILQEPEGWTAIDPQGSIAVRPMEAARFLNNHFDFTGGTADGITGLWPAVDHFAKSFGENPETIIACTFIDSVLGLCWSVEDNTPVADLETGIRRCRVLLDGMKAYSISIRLRRN